MKLTKYISDFYHTCGFLFRLIRKEDLKNYINHYGPIDMPESRELVVLANGPSLKDELSSFEKGKDYCVVNDLVNDSVFETIKPKYYVLSDPLFFVETIYKERGDLVYEKLNEKVQWRMNLYVPFNYYQITNWESKISNKNITVVPFHSVHYAGLDKFRFKVYEKGWGNGEFGTVALNAIYVGLILRYKFIYLYGMDHTFFDNLCIDKENRLCSKQSHFYSTGETVMKPLVNHYNGLEDHYGIYEYLVEKSSIFHGHSIMKEFSDKMNAKIINCTINSLIDAYTRKVNTD